MAFRKCPLQLPWLLFILSVLFNAVIVNWILQTKTEPLLLPSLWWGFEPQPDSLLATYSAHENCTRAMQYTRRHVSNVMARQCHGLGDLSGLEKEVQCQHSPLPLPFEHIYVINLPRREDRREHMVDVASKLNITMEFFPAVDSDSAQVSFHYPKTHGVNSHQLACLRSHVNVYTDMIQNGYATALILEDDADFNTSMLPQLPKIMLHMPPDWDILYLGYDADNPNDPKHLVFPPHLFHVYWACCTYGYVINLWTAVKLLSLLHNVYDAIDAMIEQSIHWDKPPRNLHGYNVFPHVVTLHKLSHLSDVPDETLVLP